MSCVYIFTMVFSGPGELVGLHRENGPNGRGSSQKQHQELHEDCIQGHQRRGQDVTQSLVQSHVGSASGDSPNHTKGTINHPWSNYIMWSWLVYTVSNICDIGYLSTYKPDNTHTVYSIVGQKIATCPDRMAKQTHTNVSIFRALRRRYSHRHKCFFLSHILFSLSHVDCDSIGTTGEIVCYV